MVKSKIKLSFSKKFIIGVLLPIIVFALVALILDRIIKEIVLFYFILSPSTVVVTSFFSLELIYNYGVSFSFLSGINSNIIMLLSFFALLLLVALFYKMFNFNKFSIKLAVGCIIGASIGNIYDRVAFGGVIDFLYFHYENYSFPVFNSADVLITFSAIILLINLLLEKKKA